MFEYVMRGDSLTPYNELPPIGIALLVIGVVIYLYSIKLMLEMK